MTIVRDPRAGPTTFAAINPATAETIREYPVHTSAQVDDVMQAADHAFAPWRRTPFAHRTKVLRQAAVILRARIEEYAALMTQEMGKPIAQARAEVEKCAWVCDYYADNGAGFLADQVVETDARKSFVSFQPLGAILAIMPWNFPFWQVIRFAAPAVMAGNVCILKHAPNVPGCALAVENVFKDAGFPEGVFRSVFVDVDEAHRIIESPVIRAVTLTGSSRAGRAVAAKAGEMLKKVVLELGGSDPYVVLSDADVEHAVSTCVTSRLINTGQSCVAAKRFIVVRGVLTRFQDLFLERMRAASMGDPTDESNTIGPLARADLRDALHDQVRRSIDDGARCLLGGELPDGPGAFYPPTVLTDVRHGMAAYDEELFGPVAAIIPVDDDAEAVQVANDTAYGLGAAVFTADLARGEQIAARELQAGSCFVNAFVKSDPRLPFGGIKASGYGRELALFGIREFVNVKTVWIS